MRGKRDSVQAEDFYTHVYAVIEAMVAAHEKHLGIEAFMISREVVMAVELDLLDFCIDIGRYDSSVRDYIDHNGYVYQHFTT